LDDRAAKFLPETNQIQINADFRVFTGMIEWRQRKCDDPSKNAVVVQVVREWFEQQLVEAILGAQSLRKSPEWTSESLNSLWSHEALTAVVMPRHHVDVTVKRSLGAKLGAFQEAT
jgi:hypothetical protein